MPGFTFPAVGRLDITSPPSRSDHSISDHRYYDPLRLPNVHLRFVRSSLSSPDTLYRPSLLFVSLLEQTRWWAELSSSTPGFRYRWISYYRHFTQGNIWISQVPRLPPWPHALASDPGGVLTTRHTASRTAAFRHHNNVGFHSRFPGKCPMTTMSKISGLHTQPAALIHPASDSRYRVCPRISLLTCWLNFNQVGLFQFNIGSTHWVTISNFMNFVQSRQSGFSLARCAFLPSWQVQALSLKVHISYFLQKCKKGKAQKWDLPFWYPKTQVV